MAKESFVETAGQKLEAVRSMDSGFQVFGADKHRYVNSPLQLSEVEAFELHNGILLPPDYREFLLEVGPGAGPYYGVWSLAEVQREIDLGWNEPEAGIFYPASSPCLLTKADVKKPWFPAPYPSNGCIPICDQGCTFMTLLVATGELAGTVWDIADESGGKGLWSPPRRPPGHIGPRAELIAMRPFPEFPSFAEWYLGWLDHCLSQLGRADLLSR